jgi:hypothetical protein
MIGKVQARHPFREPDTVKPGRKTAMESHPGACGPKLSKLYRISGVNGKKDEPFG